MSTINPESPTTMTDPTHSPIPATMQVATQQRYGAARDVVSVQTVGVPTPEPHQVLLEVKASSVNPLDVHVSEGTPYMVRLMFGLRRPKRRHLGTDVAGRVVAVGAEVDSLSVGDEVWGWTRGGAYAEYCAVAAKNLVRKPVGITFEQAGSVAIAASTALQALRDKAEVRSGERVLVNGAAGGVGTFAVQMAKHYGAHVTGVCSGRNVEMIERLGADHVVDYEVADFVDLAPFDVIIDNVGNRGPAEIVEALAPAGRHVLISGPKTNDWFGPMLWIERTKRAIRRTGRTSVSFTAELRVDDAVAINEMMGAGAVIPEVAHRYPLAEVVDAMELLSTNHARAKIAIRP